MAPAEQTKVHASPSQYVASQHLGFRAPASVLQPSPVVPNAPVIQPASQPATVNQWDAQGVSVMGQQGYRTGASEGKVSYSRVKMIHGGGKRPRQIEGFDTQPHLERLFQHVRASLSVLAMGGERAASVDALLDSVLGITAISEALLEEVQAGMPAVQLTRPFEGWVRVVTVSGEQRNVGTRIRPINLTVASPWEPVRFIMPLIVLPGLSNLVVIRQRKLREVCGIDVEDQFNDLLRRMKGARAENTSLPPSIVTQTRVHIAVEAFRESGVRNVLDEKNDEVKKIIPQGPRMLIPQAEDLKARERQQFLRAINWMRTALPGLAEKEVPLRALLGEYLSHTSKTCGVTACLAISTAEWTQARKGAWQSVKDLVEYNLLLSQRKPGRTAPLFPDGSNLFWRSCVMQVLPKS